MNPETFTLTQEAANVDVNTVEGLLSFRQALVDVHEESLTLAGDLAHEHARNALETAERTYTATLSFVDECIDRKEQGAELTDEDVDRLQEGYNALLDVLDTFSEDESLQPVEDNVSEPEEVAVVTPVPEAAHTSESLHISTFKEIPVTPVSYEVVEPQEPLVEEKVESEFAGEIRILLTEVDTELTRAETMLEKYQEITEVVAADNVINIGQHYYNQLGVSAERARNTKRRLTEYLKKGDAVSELVFEHLKDTVEEIKENLDQLETGLSQFFEADDEEVETPRASSGAVGVGKEDEAEVVVPIVVKTKEPEPESAPAPLAQEVLSSDEPHAEEKKGKIHHAPLESVPAQKAERGPRTPLSETIDHILEIPRYKQFAARNFHSKAHFEVTLRRQIQKVEAQQTSGFFYETFGYKYASAFDSFLCTMTCPEIFEFDTKPYNFKMEVMTQKNVKYETYLAWVDMMADMFEMTHAHKDITFGELFVRSELEELIDIEAMQQEAV